MSSILAGEPKTCKQEAASFRADLLGWYDKHQRSMPWRAVRGQTPNPYHVWMSEIMLQQTTVQAVRAYFLKFTDTWPTLKDLADAPREDVLNAWAGLGYYARARNLHKCAQVLRDEYGCAFPTQEEDLLKLPGIGPYTAAAISAIAFNNPANVVDGNVERVMSRIYALETPLPDAKPILKDYAAGLAEDETNRPGDYAQSLMDLGATICTPTSPKCMICPVSGHCLAKKMADPARFPRKKPKEKKPVRYGYIYFIEDGQGRFVIERRPEKGLLGNMLGFPTSDWTEDKTKLQNLDKSAAKIADIRHVFTHFELRLEGFQIILPGYKLQKHQKWEHKEDFDPKILPTVFKKFAKFALF